MDSHDANPNKASYGQHNKEYNGPEPQAETDVQRYQRYLKEAECRVQEHREIISRMNIEIVRLRSALHFIDAWKFPQPNYAYYYGSNGERDFMRAVAKNALNGID